MPLVQIIQAASCFAGQKLHQLAIIFFDLINKRLQ